MEGGKALNTESYLRRIGIDDVPAAATADVLAMLQRSHLLAVPFENLDIHWKRPIVLDIERFFEKVVTNGRGGFCYELNGLFNELLVSLGFTTRLISARVFNGTEHGPEFDHAALIVTIGENEYLADVGFGDFAAEPLRFVTDLEQHDASGTFIIKRFDDEYLEVASRERDEWKSRYIFKDIARELSEFTEMCDFQQYSPDSHFTKGKMCSLMTANGRKTLTDKSFIVTVNKERTDRPVGSADDFAEMLQREFGIAAAPFSE